MFQGPNCDKTQMCQVHLQLGSSTTKWRFYTFFDLIPLYTYLYSLRKINKKGQKKIYQNKED